MPDDPITYVFHEQLAMSQGVSVVADVGDILMKELPGAQKVHQASPCNDRKGVDWWVEMASGNHLAVDTKVRTSDWSVNHPDEDDLALESWSVIESNIVGWTRDIYKRCDYVLWLWKDTRRFCLLPFPLLCSVFIENWETWHGQYRVAIQRTPRQNGGTYHSECIFVPRETVWTAIYQRVGGAPHE